MRVTCPSPAQFQPGGSYSMRGRRLSRRLRSLGIRFRLPPNLVGPANLHCMTAVGQRQPMKHRTGGNSLGTDTGSGGDFRVLAVVPTLGARLDTLGRTLNSIVGQTGIKVDAIVVSKSVSTELSAVASSCGATVLRHDGHISAAINAGLAAAGDRHRYMFWLGDDDLLRPGALADACRALERNPSAAVCYGCCDYVDLEGNLLFRRCPPVFAPFLLRFVPGLIKQETCLFRLRDIKLVGGLDEDLRYTMDLDLLLRLQKVGRFVRVNRVLAAFCWHPGSLTIANRQTSLAEAQAVQSRHVKGATAVLFALLKNPVRRLIVYLDQRINRNSLRTA